MGKVLGALKRGREPWGIWKRLQDVSFPSVKEDKADISKAMTKAIQKVMRNIKEIGQDEVEESVQAIEKAEELKKYIKSSKVRNQSIECATRVGKPVGYLAEEENSEHFLTYI